MTHEDKENPTKYKAYCYGKYEEESVYCKAHCQYAKQCKKGIEKLSRKGLTGELADVEIYNPGEPLSKKQNG